MIKEQQLKDAERVVRLTMMVILVTAGTSKFFSEKGFLNTIQAYSKATYESTYPQYW